MDTILETSSSLLEVERGRTVAATEHKALLRATEPTRTVLVVGQIDPTLERLRRLVSALRLGRRLGLSQA